MSRHMVTWVMACIASAQATCLPCSGRASWLPGKAHFIFTAAALLSATLIHVTRSSNRVIEISLWAHDLIQGCAARPRRT